jgi:mono/diheme cytochrome c family protein
MRRIFQRNQFEGWFGRKERNERVLALSPILCVLTLAFAAIAPLSAYDAAGAKIIFRKQCTGCHTYGKGVKVGPDLRGVTERRPRSWLLSFIRSSSKVIQSGDPTAVALFHQFKQERMPDWTDLSPQQIESILDYFAADGPTQKEPDERHANTATAAEIEMGRRLFQGEIRLSSGGRTCIACHSIGNAEGTHGGSLGPDLTNTYFKYQDKALTDFLKHPCVPRSLEVSANQSLLPQESFDLKAYMARAAGLAMPALQSRSAPLKDRIVRTASPQATKRGFR